MKKMMCSLIGGLAGALALNIVHQAYQPFDHEAPRVDLVGEEALSGGLEKIGVEPPTGNRLFAATLFADIVSNAGYYSIIGIANKKQLLGVGALSGLAAGVGAITLPRMMGLSDAPVTRTTKTKILTVAWYTVGGVVAASVIKALRK